MCVSYNNVFIYDKTDEGLLREYSVQSSKAGKPGLIEAYYEQKGQNRHPITPSNPRLNATLFPKRVLNHTNETTKKVNYNTTELVYRMTLLNLLMSDKGGCNCHRVHFRCCKNDIHWDFCIVTCIFYMHSVHIKTIDRVTSETEFLCRITEANKNKILDSLRAKITFIIKKLGNTPVYAIQASLVNL